VLEVSFAECAGGRWRLNGYFVTMGLMMWKSMAGAVWNEIHPGLVMFK